MAQLVTVRRPKDGPAHRGSKLSFEPLESDVSAATKEEGDGEPVDVTAEDLEGAAPVARKPARKGSKKK